MTFVVNASANRELVEVLGLHEALVHGESRCGVCNSREWRTLYPADVAGRVPAAVAASEEVFYECGYCEQLFWPGDKYNKTMDSLATVAGSGTEAGGANGVAASPRHDACTTQPVCSDDSSRRLPKT